MVLTMHIAAHHCHVGLGSTRTQYTCSTTSNKNNILIPRKPSRHVQNIAIVTCALPDPESDFDLTADSSDDERIQASVEEEELVATSSMDRTLAMLEDESENYTWREYMDVNIKGLYDEEQAEEADRSIVGSSVTAGKRLAEIAALEEAAAASSSKVLPKEIDQDRTLPNTPPMGEMTEWDFRAMMEKRRQRHQDLLKWIERKERVGLYRTEASDWRNDVRCQHTGDQTDPDYKEWTQREIWDLITLRGNAVDPREVTLTVEEPQGRSDVVADGYRYKQEFIDWLIEEGRVIQDADINEIVDRDAEVALLASEFSDFDDFNIAEASLDNSFDEGLF